jgi:outer membrane receptor for ferrienterochelin and colicins
MSMFALVLRLLVFVVLVGSSSLVAQVPVTGTLILTIEEEMGPVDGALIRVLPLNSGHPSVTADAEGRARLVLPAGRQTLLIARIGYVAKRVPVVVSAGGEITVTVTMQMEMEMPEMEALTVSAARTERLAGETPIRVEALDAMEVDEKTQMSPGGITMMLNETNGVRVQSTSPSIGTGAVRILGLPGQYTAMLADGLPLYGGASSSLGPLDISPVDLGQVEVIKGAASALYGGQALGGVINLISKPPTGRSELLLNHTTHDVTDGAAWLSRRFSPILGGSLLLSGTSQGQQDLDADGWTDQARVRRWGVRPRVSLVDSAGRSLFVTAGYSHDDRTGGTVQGRTAPDGFPFAEGLTSRRADLGMRGRLPTRGGGNLALRAAVSSTGRERVFGPGPAEEDRLFTGFFEVTRSIADARSATVLGAVVQGDLYHNDLNDGYDHDWWTPGLFVTTEQDIGPITASGSFRADAHPQAGTRITERLAFLVRPAPAWTVRLSGGTGYAPATAQIEETEGIGLRQVRPGATLTSERSRGVTLDIAGKKGPFDVLLTGFASEIRDAVQLADAGDSTGDGILRNAPGPTKFWGGEGVAVWRFSGGKLIGTYGVLYATRPDPMTGVREDMPLQPRQRASLDLMLERPGVYRIGAEVIVYGRQALDDDPDRTQSEPYAYAMFLAMRRFGPIEVVANFENLLDVRQTDHSPLLRPTPTTGNRWTVDAWGPLDGFVANMVVRYRW